MKHLLILLLAAGLAGCASTQRQGPARSKPTVLPPLPPGFNPAKASTAPAPAARFAPASAEPTVTPGTGILQAPEIYADPDPAWGKLFIARAYQGPNTILTVEWSDTPSGPWRPVTEWSCYPAEQVILVTANGNFARVFLRGRHTPCTPGFQPASAARLSYTKDFATRTGPIKAARIEGQPVAEGFTLWKVLP